MFWILKCTINHKGILSLIRPILNLLLSSRYQVVDLEFEYRAVSTNYEGTIDLVSSSNGNHSYLFCSARH